jgi:hypothetical protein
LVVTEGKRTSAPQLSDGGEDGVRDSRRALLYALAVIAAMILYVLVFGTDGSLTLSTLSTGGIGVVALLALAFDAWRKERRPR